MFGLYYRFCVYVYSMLKLILKGMNMKKGYFYLIFVIFILVIKLKVLYFYKN